MPKATVHRIKPAIEPPFVEAPIDTLAKCLAKAYAVADLLYELANQDAHFQQLSRETVIESLDIVTLELAAASELVDSDKIRGTL